MTNIRTALLILLIAAPLSADQPLTIGTIRLQPLDVYSPQESERGALYRLADRLHIETRPGVIRKMLLFREGDVYRPELLAETERNLRKLHFLKSAKVVASPPHDGVVDVSVVTQDAWSIAPETQAGSRGGTATYGAALADHNLLGLGKSLSLGWNKTADRRRASIEYDDPLLNGDQWNTHAVYAVNSDGHDRSLAIRRPFYSFAAPWSAAFFLQNLREDDRLWSGGFETERFQRDRREIVASFGRAIRPNDFDATRISAGIQAIRDDFFRPRPDSAALPAERDYRYLFAHFEHVENDFITLNFVNMDVRYEDFNLGRSYSVTAAVSPKLAGAHVTSEKLAATWGDGVRLGASSFILPSLQAESRFDGGAQNSIVRGSVMLVRRNDTTRPSTSVARIAVTAGWRLDREVQFMADGGNGLRAYRLHEFSGSRTLIANVEHRVYLGREILQLFSPGVVVFADAGNAASRGVSSLLHLKSDVGVGIRVGLPRTPRNLLRIDVAYPLVDGPRTHRKLLVSFSSGQAF